MNELRELGDGIWTLDRPLVVAGLKIGTRTTLIRLAASGGERAGLFVHSPAPLTPELVASVRRLGDVRHLVAPNSFHHLFLRRWAEAFPEARVWAAPAVAAKTKVPLHGKLGDEPPAAWAGAIDQLHVGGAPRLDEFVFFHRQSRTLLLTDLAFHMTKTDSLMTRFFMTLNGFRGGGGFGRFGPTRLVRFVTADKKAMRASVDRILAWDFDRITVTHGDIVQKNGREIFRKSFAWL